MVECDLNYNIPINMPVYSQKKVVGNAVNTSCSCSLSCVTTDDFNLIFCFFKLLKRVSYLHKKAI